MIDQQTELLIDDMRLGIMKAVEIVCEAAYQVRPEMQARLSTLPWSEAVAVRHRLVHGYRRIDANIVLQTIRNQFPALIAELERILNERPNDGA